MEYRSNPAEAEARSHVGLKLLEGESSGHLQGRQSSGRPREGSP